MDTPLDGLAGEVRISIDVLRRVVDDPSLLRLTLALYARSNANGECWPGTARLEVDTGLKRRSLTYARRRGEELGLWTITHPNEGVRSTSVYHLHAQPTAPAQPAAPAHDDAPGDAAPCTPPAQHGAPLPVHHGAPKPATPNLLPEPATGTTTPAVAGEITARDATAAYVDAWREQYDVDPPKQNIGRVSRDAKQLLGEDRAPIDVLEAARLAALEGHANVASAYSHLVTEGKRQERYRQDSSEAIDMLRRLGQRQRAHTHPPKGELT